MATSPDELNVQSGPVRRMLPPTPEERWLAVGNFVNMVGSGATLTALVVFLSTVKGLSLPQAGLVLSLAGLTGILGSVPIGWLADRHGARGVAVLTELGCMLSVTGLILFDPAWALAACLALRQMLITGNSTARAAIMGMLVPPERRTRLRAYQRSVTNLGFAIGALLSGLVIGLGTPDTLLTLMAFDALTYLLAAGATLKLPPTRARVTDAERLSSDEPGHLPDRRRHLGGFVLAATVSALHAVSQVVFVTGLALWLVYASELPHWSVSAAVLINTVLVVALQVRLSRSATDDRGAWRALVVGGLATALGCLALAGAYDRPLALQAVAALTATGLLTVAEMYGSAGGWTLSYRWSSDATVGRYQGVWQTLTDLTTKAGGPALVALVVASGPVGWALIAAGFFALSAATAPLLSRVAPHPVAD